MSDESGAEATIPGVDGFALAATVFEPKGDPRFVTVISAAMATPRRLYEVYARYLSRGDRRHSSGELEGFPGADA